MIGKKSKDATSVDRPGKYFGPSFGKWHVALDDAGPKPNKVKVAVGKTKTAKNTKTASKIVPSPQFNSPGFVGFASDKMQQSKTSYEQFSSGSALEAAKQNANSQGVPFVDVTAQEEELAAIKERCKYLEDRLQEADCIAEEKNKQAEELEQKLNQAQILADASNKEKQLLEEQLELLQALDVSHGQEKEDLQARIQKLEKDMKKLYRPFHAAYAQKLRSRGRVV